MEIEFDNVIYDSKVISFKINSSGIYTFLGNSKSIKHLIVELIDKSIIPTSGNIIYKSNIKIGICKANQYENFSDKTIRDFLVEVLKKYNYKDKYINDRVNNSLKLVDLDNDLLNRNLSELSYIEMKKISLVISLIHNPKLIIIEDYTDGMNKRDIIDFERLIRMLKNKYKKAIILLTKNTDLSYRISDKIYLLNEKQIIKDSNKTILLNTNILNKLNLEIPPIIQFIKECNKNGHEIDYYDNILDLIKSIYREVM